MRRSPLAEKIMYPLAIARAIGESICYSIGMFVGEQNWQQLWAEDGAKS